MHVSSVLVVGFVRLADLIEKHADELALLECIDNGKPLSEAKAGDLPLVIQCYRFFAGYADKLFGSVLKPSGPFANGLFAYTDKVCGICAIPLAWVSLLVRMCARSQWASLQV